MREYKGPTEINCQENKIVITKGSYYDFTNISTIDEDLTEKTIVVLNFSDSDVPYDCRESFPTYIMKDYIVSYCAFYLNGTLKWSKISEPSFGGDIVVTLPSPQYNYPDKYKVVSGYNTRLLNLEIGVYELNIRGDLYVFGKYLLVLQNNNITLYKLPS